MQLKKKNDFEYYWKKIFFECHKIYDFGLYLKIILNSIEINNTIKKIVI